MNCPLCDVEMAELADGDAQVHVCPECSGAYLDGSQLNALLLHSNLPGVDSLGGREAPDPAEGTCPTCGVDLVRVEQRATEMFYEACEDCGFVYVPLDAPAATELEGARKGIVKYFRAFTAKKPGGR
jgi:Zn-finger nucleic acid-binding protein